MRKPTTCPVCSKKRRPPVTECKHLEVLAAYTKRHEKDWVTL